MNASTPIGNPSPQIPESTGKEINRLRIASEAGAKSREAFLVSLLSLVSLVQGFAYGGGATDAYSVPWLPAGLSRHSSWR